jgi:lauroyl/myristoyl acyltransferase
MTPADTTPPPPPVPLALRLERKGRRALFLACRSLVRSVRFERMRTVGAWLGELRFRFGWVARRRMVRELAALVGTTASDPRVRAQMREAFRSNDAAVLEILKMLDSPQDQAMLLSQVEVEGVDLLRTALAEGRGAILLATHAGNAALLAVRLVDAGIPLSMVYRESRMMDAGLFERGLAFYGVEGILATEGIRAYGRMLSALRAHRVVFVMADQGTKKARDGIVMRFLGKDMPMPAGPAQLARHARAPVLPVATTGATPRWRFEILPPVARQTGASLEADVEALLRVCEGLILRNPQWWSWHHRRWRRFPLAPRSEGPGGPRPGADGDCLSRS